jgi:hypothetical protein
MPGLLECADTAQMIKGKYVSVDFYILPGKEIGFHTVPYIAI